MPKPHTAHTPHRLHSSPHHTPTPTTATPTPHLKEMSYLSPVRYQPRRGSKKVPREVTKFLVTATCKVYSHDRFAKTLYKGETVYGHSPPLSRTIEYVKHLLVACDRYHFAYDNLVYDVPATCLKRIKPSSSSSSSSSYSTSSSSSSTPLSSTRREAPYMCHICAIPFFYESDYNIHMESHPPSPPPSPTPSSETAPRIPCPDCDFSFSNPELLASHSSVRHPSLRHPSVRHPSVRTPPPPQTEITCPFCSKSFASQPEIDIHLASHPDNPENPTTTPSFHTFSDEYVSRALQRGWTIMEAVDSYLDPQVGEVSLVKGEIVLKTPHTRIYGNRPGWAYVEKAPASPGIYAYRPKGYVPSMFLKSPSSPSSSSPSSSSPSPSTPSSSLHPPEAIRCSHCYQLSYSIESHMRLFHPNQPLVIPTSTTPPDLSPSSHASSKFGPIPSDGSDTSDGHSADHIPPPLLLSHSDLDLQEGTALGMWRGIQGDNNSCYLDATLFSLFAFDSDFDALLDSSSAENETGMSIEHLRPEVAADDTLAVYVPTLRSLLRTRIVTPLRQRLFVDRESMLQWRLCLDKVWAPLNNPQEGVCEEQDVIDFLNQMFTLLLPDNTLAPSFQSAETGPDPISSFVHMLPPIFDHETGDMTVFPGGGPSLPTLIDAYLSSTSCIFVSSPRFLILQMPREYRRSVYDCIYPSDTIAVPHADPETGEVGTTTLELTSIICIDSSHFVSYNRLPFLGKDTELSSTWVRFDSMGDRVSDDIGSVPILTPVPTLANALADPDKLASIVHDELASHKGPRSYRYTDSRVSVDTKRVLSDAYVLIFTRVEHHSNRA